MSIIAMTVNNEKHIDNSNQTISSKSCDVSDKHQEPFQFPGVKMDWDEQVKSQVLGSFFYG